MNKHRGTENTEGKNSITEKIIGAAIEVHKSLGPGLLESVYETCLCHELQLLGLSFERQKALPVIYKGIRLEAGLRIDIIVEGTVVVELKCVENIVPIHESQLLTYMRLSGLSTGLILNFYTSRMTDGIKRMVL
ncbi:MAG: GxxExxY protein [Geobacteraceae bacterium]|nr:GxxExxY protein [Geobacteraceae bacterium]